MNLKDNLRALRNIAEGKLLNPLLTKMIPKVGLCLIAGGTGSGKTCLAYGILEYKHVFYPDIPVFVYGYPPEKVSILPDWIEITDSIDDIDNSIVLVDEAYIQFHSRQSSSKENKFIDLFTGLIRQKNIFGIFISQTFRKLDIGILSSAQLVLIKKPPYFQVKTDRSTLRPVLSEALEKFAEAAKNGIPPNKCVYVISNDHDFMDIIVNSNMPPTFWSDSLSRPWSGVKLGETIEKETYVH